MTIGITGHQVIPAQALPLVEAQLEAILAAHSGFTGISSLAAGADQLFARLVLAQAGQLHAVIPCAHYETTFTTNQTAAQYQTLLKQAATSEILPYAQPGENAFLAAGQRVTDLSTLLIAIWDGEPAQGVGGTADIVAYAQQLGIPVLIAWPAGLKRS